MVLEQKLRAYTGSKNQEAERGGEVTGMVTSKTIPSDIPPPARPQVPKQFHQQGPSIQIYDPMGTILIQTTTLGLPSDSLSQN